MQWHYDFKDWEAAFKMFYRKRCGEAIRGDDGNLLGICKGDNDLVFVISTAPYSSGYWIELSESAEPDDETTVYRTVEEVKQLEQRIRNRRAETNSLSLGGVVK